MSNRTPEQRVVDYFGAFLLQRSTGELAALRRQGSDPSPSLWRALVGAEKCDRTSAWSPEAFEDREIVWATVLAAMARCVGSHRPGGMTLGEALARLDYSETRFLRLLRARGASLTAAVGTLSRYLATHDNLTFDWVGIADLLLSDDAPTRDRTRKNLARTYFGYKSRVDCPSEAL